MLHISRLHSKTINLFFFLILAFAACKKDTSTSSEEEAAYMADYEPAVNKWGFLDTEGNLVIDAIYDDVGPFSEGMAAVSKGGKWGFIDRSGKMIIEPVYKGAWAFHEGKARVQAFDSPDRFIDKTGQPMPSQDWSAADDFSDGMARIKIGNSFGYIDASGSIIIQPIYSRGLNFRKNVCVIEYQEKFGVINKKGDNLLAPEYDQIRMSGGDNILLCKKANDAIAYDFFAKELLRMPFVKMVDCDGEVVSVRDKDQMYLVNFSSPDKPSARYSNIIYLENNLWAGKRDSGYILMTNEGVQLSEVAYNQINKFSDGVAAYSKGQYWGYMDTMGVQLTAEVFGLAWDYRDGFARAAFKDGIGFIDKSQKLAFYPPRGSLDMRDFSEGLASVQME